MKRSYYWNKIKLSFKICRDFSASTFSRVGVFKTIPQGKSLLKPCIVTNEYLFKQNHESCQPRLLYITYYYPICFVLQETNFKRLKLYFLIILVQDSNLIIIQYHQYVVNYQNIKNILQFIQTYYVKVKRLNMAYPLSIYPYLIKVFFSQPNNLGLFDELVLYQLQRNSNKYIDIEKSHDRLQYNTFVLSSCSKKSLLLSPIKRDMSIFKHHESSYFPNSYNYYRNIVLKTIWQALL